MRLSKFISGMSTGIFLLNANNIKAFLFLTWVVLPAALFSNIPGTFWRTTGDKTSWENLVSAGQITSGQIVESSSLTGFSGSAINYLAPGNYNPAFLIVTNKLYGGFSGTETSIDLNVRPLTDQDGNGIVEPWEFTNIASISSSYANSNFNGTGTNTNRLLEVTGDGAEVNGVTITDFHYQQYSGAISIGKKNGDPIAADNTQSNAGILKNCIVSKVKNSPTSSSGGIVMLTNKYSLVDNCLIESNVSVVANGGGAVNLNLMGGAVKNSVIRNNASVGTGSRAGGIWARTSAGSSDATTGNGHIDAIVENCLVYNNYSAANGSGIRVDAQSGKKSIQIINSSVINNQNIGSTSGSVELINTGAIVNSIVVNPSISETGSDLRTNTTNSYIVNTIYGDSTYTAGGTKSGNSGGKITSNLNFQNPTTFTGVSIPDYTTPWDAAAIEKYNQIRQANFCITSTNSPAVAVAGITTLAVTYGTTPISTTATVPTTDNTGFQRTGGFTAGAYQATLLVDNSITQTVNHNVSLAGTTIRPTGKLNISGSKTLTTGSLLIESNENGTGTVVTGTELSPGALSVTGTSILRQYLGAQRNWYISSPLASATATAPESQIAHYYEYVEAGNNNPSGQPSGSTNFWKGLANTHTMEVGKGYIAKLNSGTTIEFSGTLNNNVSYPIAVSRTIDAGSAAGYNLIGNPYPAYIDWSKVIADPLNAGIGTTFWFRTQNTDDDYTFTTHNGTSGQTVTGTANTDITKLIPPMQAFWIRVNNAVTSPDIVLKKTMLEHRDAPNNKFKAPQNMAQASLRLQVSNGAKSDEALIYFNSNAQNSFDAWDSPKMFNNNKSIPEIYTRAGNERLVINGMNGYDFNTMIPLGFNPGQAGNFSIRASQLQNFDSDTQVYLLDKVSSSQFNLTEGESYNFTSDATSTENRFAVLFKSTTGTSSVDENAMNGMYLSAQNGRLMLQLNTSIDNARVTVFTAAGQNIHSQTVSTQTTVLNKKLNAGVYLVKVENGARSVVLRTVLK